MDQLAGGPHFIFFRPLTNNAHQTKPTKKGFTVKGLNRLEDALLGLLGLLDRGAINGGGGLPLPRPASSSSSTFPPPLDTAATAPTIEQEPEQQVTAALLLAERLGAPRALRDVTAAWHRGEVGFAAAAQRVLAALDGDEVRVSSVRWLLDHVGFY